MKKLSNIEEGRLGRNLQTSFSDKLRSEDMDVVDLGLPSGMLWCKENSVINDKSWFRELEMINGDTEVFPHLPLDDGFFIPDQEIVNELLNNTEKVIEDDKVTFVSNINHNSLVFYLDAKSYDIYHYEGFWVYDEKYGFVQFVLGTGHFRVSTDTKSNSRIRLVRKSHK